MNNNTSYNTVTNVPIGCTFCGAHVSGKVSNVQNPQTKQTESVCRWVCSRCGNLVKVGKLN